MRLTVCLGSDCHKKGAHLLFEELRRLLSEHGLSDRVELSGTYCLGTCRQAVCVSLDATVFSLRPEDAGRFLEEEILPRLSQNSLA